MKPGTVIILGIGALVVLSAFKGGNNSVIDLTGLTNDSADLQRLNSVYNALQAAGLTNQQIHYSMAQILVETGILTDQANYTAMDGRNNYAGLTNVGGGYAVYNSIQDFVTAYIGFLSKGSNPLGATSLTDFNNRLVANHYYTDSPVTYGNNLNYYYNLL